MLIGIIGWYAIDPKPSPPPEPVPSPEPEANVPLSKPEQTVPSPKPEITVLSPKPEDAEFPKPEPVPIPERDFSISRHEITFEQYDHYAKKTEISLPDDEGWGRENRPVINVNLNEAQDYADWLSEKLDQKCRLPSEDEWEYAARAGGSGDYGLGQGGVEITRDNLGDYAWYSDNAEGKTHPVGTKKPNAWGLYDMFGNVWEWCGGDGAICGGSWINSPDGLRAAYRLTLPPGYRSLNFGFRVVCVPHS